MPQVVSTTRVLMGRMPPGADICRYLEKLAREHGIAHGQVSIIGALRRARLGAYDFAARKYVTWETNGDHEILSGSGNLSPKEVRPFFPLHVVLGDEQGAVRGGHLFESEVIVGEYVLTGYAGADLVRTLDPETGLYVWPADETP